MKLYAPSYYKRFACIAGKCRHSCCVGWEIDIDPETAELYENLTEGYGRAICHSVDREETPHFRLGEGERCPHLDGRGLCRIILELGEDYLCEICREHPRFYHDTPHGKEVGIGMACEEACRLILASDDYTDFEEIEELDGDEEEWLFDGAAHRSRIFALLADQAQPYAQRLQNISRAYGVTPALLSDEKWRELFASLEYLNQEHRSLFAKYTSAPPPAEKWEKVLERALAYFVFRHCSGAWDETDFRAGLGFALVCERLLASMVCAQEGITLDGVLELARILSEELEYSEENTEELEYSEENTEAVKSCFE